MRQIIFANILQLQKNVDLNTYTTFGVYSLQFPKNYYHSNAIWCTVLVLPTNFSNSYVLQIGYASNYYDICYRLCLDGSWTSWREL